MAWTRRRFFGIIGLPLAFGSRLFAQVTQPALPPGAMPTLNSVAGPGGLVYAAIARDVSALLVRGYSTPEDQGRAVWVRGSGPGAGRRRSADGQWWTISMPVLTPQMFGASGAGDGDVANVAAFVEWTQRLGKADGFVPPGTYNLDSATLGGVGLVLPTGALISGAKGASKIVITGTAPCRLFRGTNVSDVNIGNLWLVGNSASSGSGDGYALAILQTAATTAPGSGYRINGCRFDNFGGDNWLSFTNDSASHPLTAINVGDNLFNSFPRNARGPHLITILSHCVVVGGSTVVVSKVENVRIHGNTAHCLYLKGFCIVWSGVSDCVISENVAHDVGMDSSFRDDTACYAFMKYDIQHANPSTAHFHNNAVHGVRDCGLYVADVGSVTVDGFYCSGQSSRLNDTLPKGGIALGGVGLAVLRNIRLDHCHLGISLEGQTQSSRLVVEDATTTNCENAIFLRAGARWDRIEISRWKSESASPKATALTIVIAPMGGIDVLTVSHMDIGAGASSVRSMVVGDAPRGRLWEFGGAVRRGGIALTNLPFPVVLNKITYRCADGPPGGTVLDVRGSTALTIFDQNILGIPPAGHGYAGYLAEGTIPGRMTFPDHVPLATAIRQDANTGIFGQHTPTFRGRVGAVIRNIVPPAEATDAPSLRIDGWTNDRGDRTWRPFHPGQALPSAPIAITTRLG